MAVWLVRAGSNGEQQEECLSNNLVTIGWSDLPDLSAFDNRDALKDVYIKHYPYEKQGAVNNRVGQIWSFTKRINKGDLVVLPLKNEPIIAIGEVVGVYEYSNSFGSEVQHILPVKWIDKEIPRVRFDQDLLYSFGAFMTVCNIKRNNAEKRIRLIVSGKSTSKTDYEEMEETDESSLDLADISHTNLIKFLNEKFKGHKLEELVEAILKAQGYVTNRTEKGVDGGADILAGSGPMGFDSPRVLVEVKSGDALMGSEVIDRMRGALDKFGADFGLFVAFNGFKNGIKRSYRSDFFKIRLWDQNDLLDAIYKHYEDLPEDIQAEIPLQRVWTLVR